MHIRRQTKIVQDKKIDVCDTSQQMRKKRIMVEGEQGKARKTKSNR